MERDALLAYLILLGFYPGQLNGGMAMSDGSRAYWMARNGIALKGLFPLSRPADEAAAWDRISDNALRSLAHRAMVKVPLG
jgi:hypothetical protein